VYTEHDPKVKNGSSACELYARGTDYWGGVTMRRKLWWILPLAAGFTIWAAAAAASGRASGNGGAPQNQTNPPPPETGTVLKAEARLVLVDAVVTDKKGAYVHDLTVKDFRVYEDNKEQKITSFAFEADPAIQNSQPHYMVLFFDDLSMPAPIDQANARQAAVKFVEKNASPTTLISVVDFNGQFKITQNFTANVDKLKKAVVNLKLNIGPGIGDASFSLGGMDFGLNNDLDALRFLARELSHVAGRKSLVWLTNGFVLTPEIMPYVTAIIDTCNKANVAVYPIDVRGLVAMAPVGSRILPPNWDGPVPDSSATPLPVSLASWIHPQVAAKLAFFQARGGGGAGAGGGTGSSGGSGGRGSSGSGSTGTGSSGGKSGGTTGSGGRGGGGTTTPNNANTNANNQSQLNQSRQLIIPQIPPSALDNQQVLYMVADGTGGFVILNTNDLLAGMEKIASEMNQHYLLGYVPSEESASDNACHSLKVKSERGGTIVRARTGYCNGKPIDLLAGKVEGKDLEARLASTAPGTVNATLQAPYLYSGPNTARVNVVLEFPSTDVSFKKEKGKLYAELHVLGIASRGDGVVAARFSDTVKLELADKKELPDFQSKPYHYEKQFEVAPGEYHLKVAFATDDKHFGKLDAPLIVDKHGANDFGVSSIVLGKSFTRLSNENTGLDALLLEDQVPLVYGNMQIIPAANTTYSKSQKLLLYFEIYEPLLASPDVDPAKTLACQVRILEKGSGAVKFDTQVMGVKDAKKGITMVPIAMGLPLDGLPPGSYTVELTVFDGAKRKLIRTADFTSE